MSLSAKILLTPGPSHQIPEGVLAVTGAAGRGDSGFDYQNDRAIEWLKSVSGQEQVTAFQGSGSLAVEMMVLNFVQGRVLLVESGYYSDRMRQFLLRIQAEPDSPISDVSTIEISDLESAVGTFDWVCGVYVETARAKRQDLSVLKRVADRLGAKLAIDAVASIGLEKGHEAADVLAFSSCKGLFGPTGAAFVAYTAQPLNQQLPFYLDLATHSLKKVTGPYSQMQYISGVIEVHNSLVDIVRKSKHEFMDKFREFLVTPAHDEPWIATRISREIGTTGSNVVLYEPREKLGGSVICHFGQIGLPPSVDILNTLEIREVQ
jgi:2-aminoethylphosphonate-pyruvate transaminase